MRGAPATPPPSRALRAFLAQNLELLDYAALRKAFEESDSFDCLPRWRYEHAGWIVDFFPVPKSTTARGRTDIRPLGAFQEEATWSVGCAALRDTLKKKAGKYGDLGRPFVIAVNAIDDAHDIDVKDALLGQECIQVFVSEHGPLERQSRVRDGVWWGPMANAIRNSAPFSSFLASITRRSRV